MYHVNIYWGKINRKIAKPGGSKLLINQPKYIPLGGGGVDLYHFDIMILEQLSTRPQGILYVLMYIFKVVLKNYEKTQKRFSSLFKHI